MTDEQAQAAPRGPGATAVIVHRVREGATEAFERWLAEVEPACRAAAGHLDRQVVRPIAGRTTAYTEILRFDDEASLAAWLHAPAHQALQARARPLLADADVLHLRTGLDAWQAGGAAAPPTPVRWKQFLVTWSAIFPLVLAAPLVIVPLLRSVGAPEHVALTTLAVTGPVVFLMVYVVLPPYTRAVRRWLLR